MFCTCRRPHKLEIDQFLWSCQQALPTLLRNWTLIVNTAFWLVGLTKVTIGSVRIKVHVQPKTYKSWVLVAEFSFWSLVLECPHPGVGLLRLCSSTLTACIAIADSTNIIEIKDDHAPTGPIKRHQAHDYAEGLDHIITEFQQLIKEEREKMQWVTMVQAMKCHISLQFNVMSTADIDVVIGTTKDSNCMHLWQALQEEGLQNFDPEEEVPTGQEMLKCLPPNKRYTLAVKEHIITMFDHLSNALSKQSLATANLSSLAKIADEETLDIILWAACHPMVQLNMPEKFLGPVHDLPPKTTGEALRKKIAVNLLPNGKRAALKREPENNLMRLLTAVLYLKLKKKFLNTGTQKECVEHFVVNEKQLSKLLMGRCYQGGN